MQEQEKTDPLLISIESLKFLYFIRLIRPLNLLIVAYTMAVVRYGLFGKTIFFSNSYFPLYQFGVSEFDFFLLVLSTVMIAAAGYIINDYFDIKIDRINKPKKIIVGRFIKKREAMLFHTLLNLLAMVIGVYLSWKYKNILPVLIHLTTASVLWWYSLSLKRKFLSGNLAIAVLSALVPFLGGYFELQELIIFPQTSQLVETIHPLMVIQSKIIILCLLAFLGTTIREIIKDEADKKGDAALKCKTMPFVLGERRTTFVVLSLEFLLILGLSFITFLFFPTGMQLIYLLTLVIFPILLSMITEWKANSREKHLLASNWIKFSIFTALSFVAFF